MERTGSRSPVSPTCGDRRCGQYDWHGAERDDWRGGPLDRRDEEYADRRRREAEFLQAWEAAEAAGVNVAAVARCVKASSADLSRGATVVEELGESRRRVVPQRSYYDEPSSSECHSSTQHTAARSEEFGGSTGARATRIPIRPAQQRLAHLDREAPLYWPGQDIPMNDCRLMAPWMDDGGRMTRLQDEPLQQECRSEQRQPHSSSCRVPYAWD
eukprot:CAMPEP_0119327898 /NCGR_PEP_ID=MMETSP1333-20130426/71964_1 /TAXON_ID=418940 /ORGANISM="Scyphosphaera apsteinii, Strain RCC1455" /LENGTH=213 /DNA_ID=CAMNT_0007336617 /DNA_START=242 /DNA_END=883 /DNA_ORIENTATION=-